MKKIFICLLLLTSQVLFAQDIDKKALIEAYQSLQRIEPTSFETPFFLNKGFFTGQHILPFRESGKQIGNTHFITTSPQFFLAHVRGLHRASFRHWSMRKDIEIEGQLNQLPKDESYVPIGILQATGEWLSPSELEKASLNQISKRSYEKVPIYSASILANRSLTNHVTFELLPEFFSDESGLIKGIEIDFGDKKGYRPVSVGDRISIDYLGTGQKSIGIKLIGEKDTYINHSTLWILRSSDQIQKPDFVFDITPSPTDLEKESTPSTPPSNRGARFGAPDPLPGGRAEVFVGCDGVFDRPVIVVEGFDPLNELTIDNYLRGDAILFNTEGRFRNAGFDMVYLNFDEGGDRVENLSTVLETLIRDVNTQKAGNQDIVVIGISMGGLVSRMAIRNLERGGYTHNISHFISYDSPHKGANVPVGYQTLLEDFDDIFIRDVFNIAQSSIDLGKDYLNSKAARQLLLRYKGPNPHPDFTALQNQLDFLGFPSQGGIRNVTLINGSTSGTRQAPTNNFDPDDLILSVNWITGLPLLGLVNAFVKVRTNEINGSGKVSSIWITVTVLPTTIKEKSFNFNALNFDIASGGFQTNQGAGSITLPWFLQIFNVFDWFGNTVNDFGRDGFAFVPLFSSVASTRTLNVQADLNRSVATLNSAGQIPFDQVYGTTVNTGHVNSAAIFNTWNTLLLSEFGIGTFPSCPFATLPAPPRPDIYSQYLYMCEFDIRTFYVRNQSAISNLYTYNWTVTGPMNFSAAGPSVTLSYPPPGNYTLTVTRRYNPGSGINSNLSTTYSRVIPVFASTHPTYGCEEGDDGGPIRRVAESLPLDLKVWPNPTYGSRLNIAYGLPEAGEVSIDLVWINDPSQSLLRSFKQEEASGNHTFSMDVSDLRPGLYAVRVKAGDHVSYKKLVISK